MSAEDTPERKFDAYDGENLPTATVEHEEGASNPADTKSSRKPRREVWWFDLGATNQSLQSIGRCFEDRLNRSLLSSSNSLLRHIRSRKDDNLRRNMHQCPGYLREEITLTCDVSKSVIVSHAFPGESELCSICHQLVQHTYSEPDYNNITPDGPFLRSRASSWDFVGATDGEDRNGVEGTSLFARDIVDRYRLAVFRKPSISTSRSGMGMVSGTTVVSEVTESPSPTQRRGRTPGLTFRKNLRQFLRPKSPPSSFSAK
jgi:hypothetical protein